MKKTSVSTTGSNNRLSYLDNYDELAKHNKHSGKVNRKVMKRVRKERKEVILSRGIRWFIFGVFINLAILMNYDHGTVPAATDEIRADLDITDDILGIFGSLVFLGNLIGSMISFSFINWFNRKFLLVVSLLLNAICLYTFTVTKIVWILFINRVVVGIFQAYISIYLPVWCDQFGMKNKKTIMITLIQVGSPLGVVIGFFLTSMVKDAIGWTSSFIIQAILVAVTIVVILFIPSIYFSSTLILKKHMAQKEINLLKLSEDDISVYKYSSDRFYDPSNEEIAGKNSKNKNDGVFSNLCLIFKQKVFIFSTFALASLFFVITAVQYWGSDYMEQALGVENKHYRLLSFSIVCVTSPTFGVLLGGYTSSLIGGYESKHSILLCFGYSLMAALFALVVPLANTLTVFTILLWLVLFFGGAIVPTLLGATISTLPEELRGSANSITCFFSNLLGYLPAPSVYGIINNHFKQTYKKAAFMCIMYYSWGGVVLLVFAVIFRYRQFKKAETLLSGSVTGNTQVPSENQSTVTKSLIEERKMSKNTAASPRSSVLSFHIAQVFGTYVNIDDSEMKVEEEDCEYSNSSTSNPNLSLNKKHKRNVKVNNKSISENDDEKSNEEYEENNYGERHITPVCINQQGKIIENNDNELHYKKNNNAMITQAPHSLLTPQFNILNTSANDFDMKNQAKEPNQMEGAFSKEDSIFGSKEKFSPTSKESIEIDEQFETIDIKSHSKSYQVNAEVLDIEAETKLLDEDLKNRLNTKSI